MNYELEIMVVAKELNKSAVAQTGDFKIVCSGCLKTAPIALNL
jgi:hypothetical protein